MTENHNIFEDRIGPSLYDLVLEREGWSDEFLREINEPITNQLKDIDTMSATLEDIRKSEKPIVILPDFDMDGISSGILLYAGLSELGFNATIVIPDYNRGHDLDPQYIDDITDQIPNVGAIITTDSGVNSHDIAKVANDQGILFLVTDHHQQENINPYADIIVNPNKLGETYPFSGICGAMVALEVLRHYTKTYQPIKYTDVDMLRIFAGIGTVADVMPIFYNNRKIVRDSISLAKLLYSDVDDEGNNQTSTLIDLIKMNEHSDAYVNAFLGISQILQAFAENKKLRSIDDIDEGFYGWYLAPSFNSARRVEADIEPAFRVFLTGNSKDRYDYAQKIIEINDQRIELVKQYKDEMTPYNSMVYFSDAPSGVLGLLANNIAKDTGLPALVLHVNKDGSFSGSARSPGWFPLRSHIAAQGAFAQGHEYACGVRFTSEIELIEVTEAVSNEVITIYNELLSNGDLNDNDIHLSYYGDADWDLSDENELLDTVRSLRSLKPFGHEFAEPKFNITVDLRECALTIIGSEKNHISITTKTGMKLLWWNALDHYLDLKDAKESYTSDQSTITFKTKLDINEYNGTTSINAIIDKIVK